MPIPADDELLVRVLATGLNHADTAPMRGEPLILRLAYGLRRPKVRVRGLDLAGVVEAIGSKVTTFSPGGEVYAQIETGSFAEYAVVPERALKASIPACGMAAACSKLILGDLGVKALSGAQMIPDKRIAEGFNCHPHETPLFTFQCKQHLVLNLNRSTSGNSAEHMTPGFPSATATDTPAPSSPADSPRASGATSSPTPSLTAASTTPTLSTWEVTASAKPTPPGRAVRGSSLPWLGWQLGT